MATTYNIQGGNLTANPAAGQVAIPATNPLNNTQSLGLAPKLNSDPYTIFNQNIAKMLTEIQNAGTAGAAKLGAAKDALTTQSVTSQPYNPGMTPEANIQSISNMPSAFAPAITSINTQLQNTNAALGSLKDVASQQAEIYQPQVLQAGQSLVDKSGKVITQGHQYQPAINTLTGLMDGFDVNTGTWASDDKSWVFMLPTLITPLP